MSPSVKTVEPWLKKFILAETTAVLDWKQRTIGNPDLKPDPEDERFQDDGSNFRIEVVRNNIYPQSYVQLVKVLSADKPVTVLLSDSDTTIRAILSYKAVKSYEEQIDDEFDESLANDILRLDGYTISITPFGPAASRVQLNLRQLNWETTRRKLIGTPDALHESPEIQEKLSDVLHFREEPCDDEASSMLQSPVQPVESSAGQDSAQTSAAQPGPRASDVQDTIVYTQPDSAVQTQPDNAKKQAQSRRSANMAMTIDPRDLLPVAAGFKTPHKYVDAPHNQLLGLLHNHAPQQTAKEDKHTVPISIKPVKETPMAELRKQLATLQQMQTTKRKKSSKRTTTIGPPFRIPRKQQLLLAMDFNWGQRAAKRLPEGLIEAWAKIRLAAGVNNSRVSLPRVQPGTVSPTTKPKNAIKAQGQTSQAVALPEADAKNENEDDEPVGSSQWSISPSPRKRPELPPDSSGIIRATPSPSLARGLFSNAESVEKVVSRSTLMFGQEQYKAKRRAYFRPEQRRKWLEHEYNGPDAKPFDAREACAEYGKKYDNDPVNEEEMKESYAETISKSWPPNKRQKLTHATTGDEDQVRAGEARPVGPLLNENTTKHEHSLDNRTIESVMVQLNEEQLPQIVDNTKAHPMDGRKLTTPPKHQGGNTNTQQILPGQSFSTSPSKSEQLSTDPSHEHLHKGQGPGTRDDHAAMEDEANIEYENRTAEKADLASNGHRSYDMIQENVEEVIQHSGEHLNTSKENDTNGEEVMVSNHDTGRVPATVLKDSTRQNNDIKPQRRQPRLDTTTERFDKHQGQEQQMNDLVSQQQQLSSPDVTAENPDKHQDQDQQMDDIRHQQQRSKSNAIAESPDKHSHPSREATLTRFDVFARAWHELKPGGAFAKQQQITNTRPAMDVLSWKLA